jgi:hypothetical protein
MAEYHTPLYTSLTSGRLTALPCRALEFCLPTKSASVPCGTVSDRSRIYPGELRLGPRAVARPARGQRRSRYSQDATGLGGDLQLGLEQPLGPSAGRMYTNVPSCFRGDRAHRES